MSGKKVCVIGAGPSGMSVLSWVSHLAREGRQVPQVVCYEKQADWGGLWNYSWRTGTDQYGETVHGSMYRSEAKSNLSISTSSCPGTSGLMDPRSVWSSLSTLSRSTSANRYPPSRPGRSSSTTSRVGGGRRT